MRLVLSMGILSVFVKNVVEIGPNYGENGSSRFQNWIYHSENSKNTFFNTFFDTAKIENLDFRPFDEYANSLCVGGHCFGPQGSCIKRSNLLFGQFKWGGATLSPIGNHDY